MNVLMIGEQNSGLPGRWIGPMLARAGLNIRFVFQEDAPATKLARAQGLKVEVLPFRGRFDFESLRGLRRILRETRPNVIHAYTARTGWLAVWAQWPRKRAKLVLFRGAIRKLSRWSLSDHLLFRTNWVDTMDCISGAVAASLVDGGVPNEKILVNHFGMSAEWFGSAAPPAQVTGKGARFRVGCIANYRKVKGMETLVGAADILQERGLDFECMLVGQDSRGKLAACVSQAKSRARIRLPGPVPEAWRVLRTFDCAVVPSLQEAFPFAGLEALTCGVPLVASAVGGLKEMVEDGWNGLLVEPGNPRKLADAIQTVLQDAALRQRFRTNGLRTMENKFNPKLTRDRLLALYARLANESPFAASAASLTPGTPRPPS